MLAVCLTTLFLAACDPGDSGPGPDEATAGETRALGKAAEMLGKQRLAPKPAATPDQATPAPAAR